MKEQRVKYITIYGKCRKWKSQLTFDCMDSILFGTFYNSTFVGSIDGDRVSILNSTEFGILKLK